MSILRYIPIYNKNSTSVSKSSLGNDRNEDTTCHSLITYQWCLNHVAKRKFHRCILKKEISQWHLNQQCHTQKGNFISMNVNYIILGAYKIICRKRSKGLTYFYPFTLFHHRYKGKSSKRRVIRHMILIGCAYRQKDCQSEFLEMTI